MASTVETPTNFALSIVTSLMKNYQSGSPVSYDREIATAKDENGNVMFFSIGNDDHLYLYSKDPGSSKGWKRLDLSNDLGPDIQVLHIATAQNQYGKPILVSAVQDKTRSSTKLVYETQNFEDIPSEPRWVQHSSMDDVDITHIATGAGKDGKTLIAISTQKGAQVTSYLLNPDPADTSWLSREVPTPLNSKGVYDIAIGHNARLEHIQDVTALLYVLFQMQDDSGQLWVTSLPDFSYYNHQIALDDDISAFGIIGTIAGDTDLVLGSKLLTYLTPALQLTKDAGNVKNNAVSLNTKAFSHKVKKVVNGRTQDGSLESWILTEDGMLYFSLQQSAGGTWSDPFPLQKNIGELTAWRNDQTNAIDIFVVDLNNQLYHLWQDQVTTRWTTQPIILEDLSNTIEYNSYVTQLTLTDQNNAPVANQKVTLHASELAMVTVNGSSYFIDQQNDAAECFTDAQGQITIIIRATGLVCPLLRIEADFLDKVLDIDPTADIKQKLSQLSVDDFKNAQLQTRSDDVHEPLFKPGSNTDIEGAHQAIQELVKLQGTLPSQSSGLNASVSSRNGNSVAVKDKGSTYSNQLAIDSLPPAYTWRLDLTGSTPTFHSQTNATTSSTPMQASALIRMSVNTPFEVVEQRFGDAWSSIKNGILEVTHLVVSKVEDGIQIILHGIESAISVVVKFAEQVWEVIQYVFEKIKVFIEEIILWLGFLFKWGDILRTHQVFVNLTNHGLDYLIEQIPSGKEKADNFFNMLMERVVGKDLAEQMGDNGNKKFNEVSSSLLGSLLNSPEANWVFYQIMHGGASGSVPEPSKSADGGTGLSAALEHFTPFMDNLEKVLEDIVSNFGQQSFADIAHQVLTFIEAGFIQAAKLATDGLLDAAQAILSAFKSLLNAEIDIPILTFLYEKIIAPGSTFSALDLLCLIAAIPATIICKLVLGRTPFTPDQTDAVSRAGHYEAVMQALVGVQSSTPSPTLRSTSMARNDAGVTLASFNEKDDLAENFQSQNAVDAGLNEKDDLVESLQNQKALDASYGLGICSAISTFLGRFFTTTQGGHDNPPPYIRYLAGGLGIIGTLCNLTAIGILAVNAPPKTFTQRLVFENAMTVLEMGYSILDAANVCWKIFGSPSEAQSDRLQWASAGLKSVTAVFDLGMIIGLYTWEHLDGVATTNNGLKFGQNLSKSLYFLPSAPLKVIEGLPKVVLLVAQGVLATSELAINSTRIGLNHKDGIYHLNA